MHLLVFDECHHTHKGHAYNRIMQFFHSAPGGWNLTGCLCLCTLLQGVRNAAGAMLCCFRTWAARAIHMPRRCVHGALPARPHAAAEPRPHIFGMTASPANIRQKQGQSHMAANIRALETNLHAKVGLLALCCTVLCRAVPC